jgi:hypothetical protein
VVEAYTDTTSFTYSTVYITYWNTSHQTYTSGGCARGCM